jgi:hypothetical protein
MITRVRLLPIAVLACAVLVLARPAVAGPPLLCFPFDIGGARSLPMGHGDWHDTDPGYDASRLVDDTLAILTPIAPVNVRMETIRRATIYASKSPDTARALLATLEARAQHAPPPAAARAVFDFGYLVETYREGRWAFSYRLPSVDRIDGYQLVLKAHAMQIDPAIDRAAALIQQGLPKAAPKAGGRD